MISSQRRHASCPLINRHFEFTRLQKQIIASAYESLVPVVGRRAGAEQKCPQGHSTAAARSDLPRSSGTGA
jgi:hypothetical protein